MKLFSNLFQKFLLLMLALSVSISVDAYDFEVANEDGVVIYYNIVSEADKTCEVTYRSTTYYNYDDYSGTVKIPETVIYSSMSYKVTTIGNSAFYFCTGLTSIIIPSSVTTIGQEAFYACSGLNSITIPSSVTTIEQEAFYSCSNLREIIFNSSPKIGSNAFSYDDRISFIYINATTAPYMGSSSFTDEVYQYAYLHIPMGCYEEFSSAYGWRRFNRIKEDLDVNGTTYYTSLRIKQSDLGYVDQYVKVDEEYTVYIAPEGNRRINTVLFNGEDVTEQLVDGYYTTPIIKGRSVLSVSYEEINGVKEIPVSSLKVYGYNGVLYIKDADDNAPLNVYDIDGKLVYNATIANGEATIQLPSSEIYAVKVGERTIKVAL